MFQGLRQSDGSSQGTLQRAADASGLAAGELTAHRLTYDTARALGNYLALRGVDMSVQHAVIQLFAVVLIDALGLSRDEAERVVLEVLDATGRGRQS